MSNLRRPTQYRTPITAVTETATEKSCGDCSQSHIPFNNVVGGGSRTQASKCTQSTSRTDRTPPLIRINSRANTTAIMVIVSVNVIPMIAVTKPRLGDV